MSFFDFTLMATVAALGWFWFDSLAAREAGVAAARRACQSEGLQLLDETIALSRVTLARNERGTLMLKRIYAFEYSDTGDNRLRGSVHLLGSRVVLLDLGSLLLTE